MRARSIFIRFLVARKKSWRQPVQLPRASGLFGVLKTIVQTIRSSLPKLDAFRRETEPSPMRRPGHMLARIFGRDFAESALELSAIGDDFALAGRPCREAAAERSGIEIFVGLGGRYLVDFAGDADLPFELCPEDRQRRVRILRQFPALAAL